MVGMIRITIVIIYRYTAWISISLLSRDYFLYVQILIFLGSFESVKFVILFCLQLEDIVCDKGAKARGQKDISRGQERSKTQRFLYFIKYFLSPPKFDYFFKTQNPRESTDKKTSREIFEILKVRSKIRFNFSLVWWLILSWETFSIWLPI